MLVMRVDKGVKWPRTLYSRMRAIVHILLEPRMKETTMKYLVTGATGDVGSRVVQLLLQRGDRPHVFVRDAEKARTHFGDRVDPIALDQWVIENAAAFR